VSQATAHLPAAPRQRLRGSRSAGPRPRQCAARSAARAATGVAGVVRRHSARRAGFRGGGFQRIGLYCPALTSIHGRSRHIFIAGSGRRRKRAGRAGCAHLVAEQRSGARARQSCRERAANSLLHRRGRVSARLRGAAAAGLSGHCGVCMRNSAVRGHRAEERRREPGAGSLACAGTDEVEARYHSSSLELCGTEPGALRQHKTASS
jgi:hypothetical protein